MSKSPPCSASLLLSKALPHHQSASASKFMSSAEGLEGHVGKQSLAKRSPLVSSSLSPSSHCLYSLNWSKTKMIYFITQPHDKQQCEVYAVTNLIGASLVSSAAHESHDHLWKPSIQTCRLFAHGTLSCLKTKTSLQGYGAFSSQTLLPHTGLISVCWSCTAVRDRNTAVSENQRRVISFACWVFWQFLTENK